MRTDAHLFDAVYWIYNCRIHRTIVEMELYHFTAARARRAAMNADNGFVGAAAVRQAKLLC